MDVLSWAGTSSADTTAWRNTRPCASNVLTHSGAKGALEACASTKAVASSKDIKGARTMGLTPTQEK
jgi:hypothetical protein